MARLTTPEEVRSELLEFLRKTQLGPETEDEKLPERPGRRYMIGILFPPDTPMEAEDDDAGPNAAEETTEEREADLPIPFSRVTRPSSLGLTFVVVGWDTDLDFAIKGARYVLQEEPVQEGKHDAKTQDKEPAKLTSRKTRRVWLRKPFSISFNEHPADEILRREVVSGLELTVKSKELPEKNGVVLTTMLTNRMTALPASDHAADERSFFQIEMRITCRHKGKPAVLSRVLRPRVSDEDFDSNELLYRNVRQYAIGHGCAADWGLELDNRAETVVTEWIPAVEVAPVETEPTQTSPALDLANLSSDGTPSHELVASLQSFVAEYRAWIESQESQVELLPSSLQAIARTHLRRCTTARNRMEQGIELLQTDQQAMRSFRLANEAMRMQMLRHREAVEPGAAEEGKPLRWRPFQLAFILMNIVGIVQPGSADRRTVDLLWFATGAGKTEAYLGLAAFTILLRRMRHAKRDDGGGVAVITRYTLRLLTIQQFQRASSLICACEVLRRRNEDLLGTTPISIGLWVGNEATPNRRSDARQALSKLRANQPLPGGNPVQLLKCPWCYSVLDYGCYTVDDNGLRIRCSEEGCDFRTGLPAYTIDEDIYAYRPTFVVGTVDKFAQLPWNESSQALFSCDASFQPPELIIQDELHLISGPLGTLVGAYETAIDALCSRGGVPPKIIGSTATIRKAREQAAQLFARPEFFQFPPHGLSVDDSHFARLRRSSTGRMYVGIFAAGYSVKWALLRVVGALTQCIQDLDCPEELKDPYWTLIGYFNSLRELGGAVRLVEDDIPRYMKTLAGFVGTRQRVLGLAEELTSRMKSSEVPELLHRLEIPYPASGLEVPINVLLATNMISVGVDVQRLGLMAVNGQPKSTAEYIQATSRIGRRSPGLVVSIFNWTRPRDRSHYESFRDYHQAFYRHIETSSVTPFARRARDRALAGTIVTMVRHLAPNLRHNATAGHIQAAMPQVESLVDDVIARIGLVDPQEKQDASGQLHQIIDDWAAAARLSRGLVYYAASASGRLLAGAEEISPPTPSLRLPHSLREVEQEAGYFLVKED
jgi:hypothetical protein